MSQNLLYCQNQFSVQEVAKMLGRSRGFVDRRRMDIGFYQAGGRRTRGRWRVLTPCLQYYMESRHEYLGFQCVVKGRTVCVVSDDLGFVQNVFRSLGATAEPIGVGVSTKGFKRMDGKRTCPFCLIVDQSRYNAEEAGVFETLLSTRGRKPRATFVIAPEGTLTTALPFNTVYFPDFAMRTLVADVEAQLRRAR
ncbi:MAG TPA: hypothetical protein PLP17_12975 [Oligoflexia bacterium]|nr:hypothetical protein [Oligoflexia bacterium]